jgi:hypothetical protein
MNSPIMADLSANAHEAKRILAVLCISVAIAVVSSVARADEGGTSFWLPGQMGSFAAVPADPGWSLATVYYHSSTSADADKLFPRSGRLISGLDATADFVFVVPSYAFSEPMLGAQAAISMTGAFGRVNVDVDATLTGPGGNQLSGRQSDSHSGIGDLYPMGSLKWNRGAHNFMAYTMLGIPVGAYDVERLANLGINHGSADGGGGYSYLDAEKGHEFSAVLGFTYNFENDATHYKSGIDGHLDWAASQFLSEQTHIGLVGYFYRQLSGDSGAGAVLGDFKSQVSAIGPQVGYFFPVGGRKWYLNLKGIYEFDASNRPDGWNAWVTLSIPLSSAPAMSP